MWFVNNARCVFSESGARPPGRAGRRLRRVWSKFLDGAHLWGSFDATVGRFGLRRYRLVIFPPGISATDRRLLRLWRGWPVGGAVLALLALMLLGDAVAPPGITLLVVAAAYLGVGAALFVVTAGVRAGVRSMALILLAGDLDPRERQSFAEWDVLVDLLTTADDELAAGKIAPVQYEASWWQAYDRLGAQVHV